MIRIVMSGAFGRASSRRICWQLMHYWSIVRLRRKAVVISVVASLALCAVSLTFQPWVYRATAVVAVPGICPHGIMDGETYVGIMGLGNTNRWITKVVCSQCRANQR